MKLLIRILASASIIINASFLIKCAVASKKTTIPPTATTTTSAVFISEVNDIETIHNKIVNRHDFEFILNPEYKICKSESLFLLIYVHSAPGNLKRRLSIRETWAKRSMFRDIRIVFMMGSDNDLKMNNLVKLENSVYSDIVQENYLDSYKNLTYTGKI